MTKRGTRARSGRLATIVAFLVISSLAAAGRASAERAPAQLPNVRPDLDPPGADPVAEGEVLRLSPSEERRLLRQILWQPEPEWSVLANAEVMEELIGRSRQRRLEEARFHLHLSYDDWELRTLDDNPYAYERMKDSVLSAYVKLQREILEDAFQIEERLDRWVDGLTGYEERRERIASRPGRSYHLRISPRFSVGGNEYMGLKFRLPYTGNGFLDHFSFRVRHYFDRDQPRIMLKYDDDDTFIHLEYEPDTNEEGDKIGLSMRFWF